VYATVNGCDCDAGFAFFIRIATKRDDVTEASPIAKNSPAVLTDVHLRALLSTHFW